MRLIIGIFSFFILLWEQINRNIREVSTYRIVFVSGLTFVVLAIAPFYLPATLQSAPAIAAPVDSDSPVSDQVMIPLGYPVSISVDQEVSSKTSKAGDYFPLSLYAPIIIEGTEILPAGASGRGQVVHAKKGGFSGSAGELILAARYIEYNGRQISLRSFKFPEATVQAGGTGKDNTGLVTAVNVAAGPLGFLISGGNIVVVSGTRANAKFKEDTYFPRGKAVVPVVAESQDITENVNESNVKKGPE